MAQPKKRPFVSLKGMETGRITSAGKPVYRYKGEEISEKSIDIEADGKTYVIPTVIDGKLYTEEAAVAKFFNKEVEPIKVLKENIKERSKKLAEGGTAMKKQMELFEDGGLKDEGGMTDEVSGNDVPSGSTREEVRDDIPAQLSEGEFVFPADVVRYIGLEKLMMLRQEAKQGLKQMEAMGQMGNSDEATMPDDLPFDETDLDIEDDLEYNTGGVVQAQQGTYVAPTVPTQYRNESMETTNPMAMQQIQAGLNTGVNTAAPYVPNMRKMYTPEAQAYAPVSYNQFLGANATGAPQTETVRYFNAATGQTRMIPHLVNADGSRGATLYPVPEGFVIQEEAPKEEAKKTTKVQSTQVQQQQDDGGDSEPMDTSTKDPSGISYNRSTLQSEELKSLFDKVGVFSGLSILNPSLNIARSAMGKGNVASASNAALGGIIDGFRGGDVNYFGTNARNTGLQSGTYDNNKSLNSLSFEKQSQIGRVGSVVFSSVIDPMIYDTDANGKKTAKSDTDIRNNAINKAKELGLDITIPNTNIALRTETIIREIAKKEYEKEAQADTAFDLSQRATTEEDSVYGDTVDRGVGAGVGFNVGSGNDYDPSDDGPSAGADSYDEYSDTSFEGSYEDDDMYNKGGLAGKKKTPKPKKMKRGGLASR